MKPDTAVHAGARAANSYDFVRFCAASFVIVSHHFDLAGFPEPQVPFYGEDLGQLGVEIFFSLSGFLICLSLQRSPDWLRFACARLLRIFPNLLFVLVVTSAVTWLYYRNGANTGAHVAYVANNAMMFVREIVQVIPGVFTDALRRTVNDPLWTLPYELWLYVALAVIVIASGARTPARARAATIAAALAVSLAWTATANVDEVKLGPIESFDLFRLASYFLSGAVLAWFWPSLERHALTLGIAGLAGMFGFRALMPADTILVSLSVAAATVGLGSSRAMAWFARGGDASYGMYIFGWPVQQFSLLLAGAFWPSLAAAFAVTTLIGYATWHGFEKRTLAQRERLAAWLRSKTVTRSA